MCKTEIYCIYTSTVAYDDQLVSLSTNIALFTGAFIIFGNCVSSVITALCWLNFALLDIFIHKSPKYQVHSRGKRVNVDTVCLWMYRARNTFCDRQIHFRYIFKKKFSCFVFNTIFPLSILFFQLIFTSLLSTFSQVKPAMCWRRTAGHFCIGMHCWSLKALVWSLRQLLSEVTGREDTERCREKSGRCVRCRGWSQGRVKAANMKSGKKARLVFLVPAYLLKVGRAHVNSSAQSTHSSAWGLASVLWTESLKRHRKVQWFICILHPRFCVNFA